MVAVFQEEDCHHSCQPALLECRERLEPDPRLADPQDPARIADRFTWPDRAF